MNTHEYSDRLDQLLVRAGIEQELNAEFKKLSQDIFLAEELLLNRAVQIMKVKDSLTPLLKKKATDLQAVKQAVGKAIAIINA